MQLYKSKKIKNSPPELWHFGHETPAIIYSTDHRTITLTSACSLLVLTSLFIHGRICFFALIWNYHINPMNEMSFYVEINSVTFLTQSMVHLKLCIPHPCAISLSSIESCRKK